MMDRRIFLATVAGLLASPLAAEAQQAASTNVLLHAVLATAGGGQAGRGAPGASPDRLSR